MTMKKRVLMMTLACWVTLTGKAQVYAYDNWMPMPTIDMYDTGSINALIMAARENAARRRAEENRVRATFDRYCDLALTAYKREQWGNVIYFVDEALKTEYVSGMLYYLRGSANEALDNDKEAARDYKKGIKYNCKEAKLALEALKQRHKERKKEK